MELAETIAQVARIGTIGSAIAPIAGIIILGALLWVTCRGALDAK